jgi:hypothetical protein
MAAARAFADLGRVARLHSLAVGIIKKGYPSRHPAQLATCSNDFNSRSFAANLLLRFQHTQRFVWSVIQFTSQVLPPSSENACSKWGDFVAIFDQTKRT